MQRAEDALPEVGIPVQKAQITLLNRHAFACVSPLSVLRKARIPQSSITLTSGLDHLLASARIDAKTEAYPGRWTHHLVICDAAELDSELLPGCMRHASSLHANGRCSRRERQAACSRQLIKIGGGSHDGCRPFSPALFNQMPCGINSRICLRPCSMLPRGLAANTMLCTGRRCSVVRRATPLGAADS